jgi:hypothetical protein
MTLVRIRTSYILAARMNHGRSTVNYVVIFTLGRNDLASTPQRTNNRQFWEAVNSRNLLCNMSKRYLRTNKSMIHVQLFTPQEGLCKHQGHNVQIIDNPGSLFFTKSPLLHESAVHDVKPWSGLVWFGLVWFSLFVHPISQICNIEHIKSRLQFTTQLIRTSTQYNIINNNSKFKDQLEVEFVTTSRYMCIYINIPKS